MALQDATSEVLVDTLERSLRNRRIAKHVGIFLTVMTKVITPNSTGERNAIIGLHNTGC